MILCLLILEALWGSDIVSCKYRIQISIIIQLFCMYETEKRNACMCMFSHIVEKDVAYSHYLQGLIWHCDMLGGKKKQSRGEAFSPRTFWI